jgi:hypothetical protein
MQPLAQSSEKTGRMGRCLQRERMAGRRGRRRCAKRAALLDPLVVRALSFDFKAVAITVGQPMDTAHAALRTSPHPLDPLSTSEIALAAAIVRAAHDLDAGMRFETIVLHEEFDAAGSAPRRAFVSFYDIATGNLFEAVVSLTGGTVESCVPRPGAGRADRQAASRFSRGTRQAGHHRRVAGVQRSLVLRRIRASG